jgi:diguanylate cyclase (GGDEF)-like protein
LTTLPPSSGASYWRLLDPFAGRAVGKLTRREKRWLPLTECGYTIAAVLAWFGLPAGHSALSPDAVGIAIAAFALGTLIYIPMDRGYGTAVQPAFVLLLFAVPLNTVPAIALAVTALVRIPSVLKSGQWERLICLQGDCWYVLPPTLILAAAAPGPFDWAHSLVYVGAFTAQAAAALLIGVGLLSLDGNRTPIRVGLLAIGLDLLLTPVGLLTASADMRHPAAAAFGLSGLMAVFLLLSFERTNGLMQAHRALHDPLTGLPNRALFDSMLTTAAHRVHRAGRRGVVVLADLDNFKAVNDIYGHRCGDEVLRAVARRLTDVLRRADIVARLGGDEFAILLEDEAETNVEQVMRKLRAAFTLPLELPDGRIIAVGWSAGAGRFAGADDIEEVLLRADAEMYEHKRSRAQTRHPELVG